MHGDRELTTFQLEFLSRRAHRYRACGDPARRIRADGLRAHVLSNAHDTLPRETRLLSVSTVARKSFARSACG
ncbi:hypothetical protein GCM10015535_32350 [Streptomyces gelaticus]|uniref:Transposase n=1 Tax=Streptomyces gelaticus TaxID=285446 RepID=A0ABQ2VZQ3_9ACTN|nr:hypothetical protein GCM10015535_32350 [Streptomyces gelaticus]